MGAWDEISCWNLVQMNFKAAEKHLQLFYLATSVTPWQMDPTCTNGVKQHQPLCLHCNKNQTLGHMVAGCETSLREKRKYRHDSILVNLGRNLNLLNLYTYAQIFQGINALL